MLFTNLLTDSGDLLGGSWKAGGCEDGLAERHVMSDGSGKGLRPTKAKADRARLQ
jgi:hypothetical protein